jgi:hypothetical protein
MVIESMDTKTIKKIAGIVDESTSGFLTTQGNMGN